MKIIDIHNHMLPFVDDSSMNIETTIKMIQNCLEQEIENVFMTPHVNSSVSKTNREKHNEIFLKIKDHAKKYKINLFLGAEIYISNKIPKLDFKKLVMGDSNFLLIEFSTHHSSPIIDICHDLSKRGFRIIIAHVERYKYLDMNDLLELKTMGIYMQVNASSIINSSFFKKNNALFYIKKNLIEFVASDSHNNTSRPQNLKSAYKKVSKIINEEKASEIFYKNQKDLLIRKS